MSRVDILAFYLSERSDVAEDEKAEKEKSGGINYVEVTASQHKAQQKPPLHRSSLRQCLYPFSAR